MTVEVGCRGLLREFGQSFCCLVLQPSLVILPPGPVVRESGRDLIQTGQRCLLALGLSPINLLPSLPVNLLPSSVVLVQP